MQTHTLLPHRVLVMERLRGVALTDLDAIRRTTSVEPEGVLINALNTWFGSVVGCETFHAGECVWCGEGKGWW
jgi:hypothetical protein